MCNLLLQTDQFFFKVLNLSLQSINCIIFVFDGKLKLFVLLCLYFEAIFKRLQVHFAVQFLLRDIAELALESMELSILLFAQTLHLEDSFLAHFNLYKQRSDLIMEHCVQLVAFGAL